MQQHNASEPAGILKKHLHLFTASPLPGPVLDLACGSGRNGLFLAEQGLEVYFWDRDQSGLQKIHDLALEKKLKVHTKEVDLEAESESTLPPSFFGAVLVFRYLHRPLLPDIKNTLKPGGIIVYETFTSSQALLGRPTNPDFLLRDRELYSWFQDWEILHYFEGKTEAPQEYLAGLIARKPS
ncbi:Methyltransferase type 12 [Desulfonatronospira thiodismutans ASO3-1]|uniref:Methyltransferase type 12 n=1 Tax=Desulfonatronospira thiodismutans ASO3-1 TaxID=555779 RepID=D6SUJ0_9BACT|nr:MULTISPECIES: methyltransferase domain-containing protein [Desulfonatronospira]EFI32970.1 Methyltransferase type 12 [Desulfonatronospira thiodismutans ASO3-1]RQD74559.1 MAG: methyltransferase domain-containing protein [Desulfonatronospira sp. MSAO_Bac3]